MLKNSKKNLEKSQHKLSDSTEYLPVRICTNGKLWKIVKIQKMTDFYFRMTEKDVEIRNIIEKLDSKSPFDHFEEVINFIEDEENHKIIRKKNLISLFLHKRYLPNCNEWLCHGLKPYIDATYP